MGKCGHSQMSKSEKYPSSLIDKSASVSCLEYASVLSITTFGESMVSLENEKVSNCIRAYLIVQFENSIVNSEMNQVLSIATFTVLPTFGKINSSDSSCIMYLKEVCP